MRLGLLLWPVLLPALAPGQDQEEGAGPPVRHSQRARAGQASRPSRSKKVPQVAIYRDRGVWKVEAEHALPALLDRLSVPWTWIDARAIADGGLLRQKRPAFRLLIVPGGWAPDYIERLGGWSGAGKGDDALRSFLRAGGRYLGFCAGAFATARVVRWQGKSYHYPWAFFNGRAEGPLPWNPCQGDILRATHGSALLDLSQACFRQTGLPAVIRPLLYGGPRFVVLGPRKTPRDWQVLARHGEDKSAAIVSFRLGRQHGLVILCSFHPAVLTGDEGRFDHDRDTLAAQGAGRDPDGEIPDWTLAAALIRLGIGAAPGPLPR